MAGLNLDIDTSDLSDGLKEFERRAEAAIQLYAETSALKLQNHARENAPWTDRTGHARQRLSGKAEPTDTGYDLILAHGVDYGIFLELANEKRYAIIQQTIDYIGSTQIMPGLRRLLENLR